MLVGVLYTFFKNNKNKDRRVECGKYVYIIYKYSLNFKKIGFKWNISENNNTWIFILSSNANPNKINITKLI